jgi:hypothetical protein
MCSELRCPGFGHLLTSLSQDRCAHHRADASACGQLHDPEPRHFCAWACIQPAEPPALCVVINPSARS